MLPAGADDLRSVEGDLAFRYARPGDDFLDMGASDEAGGPLADPPKLAEVVYANSEKLLCRRWNWGQDARSVIRPTTESVIATLQANGWGDPSPAAEQLADILHRECGGTYEIFIIDADHPWQDLAVPPPGNLSG